MRKTYSKPYLLVESFQLDAAVAASCSASGKAPIHFTLDTCKAVEETGSTYIGNQCVHDVKVEGDGNDLICYHGPMSEVETMFMNS